MLCIWALSNRDPVDNIGCELNSCGPAQGPLTNTLMNLQGQLTPYTFGTTGGFSGVPRNFVRGVEGGGVFNKFS